MIKTGIVISTQNRKAGIMTSSGEFVYIKISKVLPKVGEIYTGELCRKNLPFYKYVITAASLMFIFASSSFAYSYYTPVTTIVVSINPSISLEANRWNKIISSKALNSDGSLILNNIKLKNKSIDAGLELLVKEAKTENFINDKYVNDKKVISVDIKSNKNSSIDISNFKNIIDNNKLTIKINASSVNNKSIDITVDNKKVSTSNLNPNNLEKKSNINNNAPIKKPLIDSNTNINKNKPTKTKEEIKKNSKTTITEDTKIREDEKLDNNKNSNSDSSTTKKSEPAKKNEPIKKSEPIKKNEPIKKSDDSNKDKKDKKNEKDKKY